jgi:hypothetical protein
MKQSALCLILAACCAAQSTKIDLRQQSSDPDFSAMPHTRPIAVGDVLPPTCQVGELFFYTVPPAGQNLYSCTAAGNWARGIVGPASSTSNALVRWDSINGTAIKDSGVTVDDSGNATFAGSVTTGDGSTPGCVTLSEKSANGSNFLRLCAPDLLGQDLEWDLPDGTPSPGQILTLGAPANGKSQFGYTTLYNQTIQNAGSALTPRSTLNFTGGGVACTDNSASNRTDCTIPGPQIDPSTVQIYDEFLPGAYATSGSIFNLSGQLGWTPFGNLTPNNLSAQNGFPMPGYAALTTDPSANGTAGLHLAGYGFGAPWFYNAAATTNWEFQFTFQSDPNYSTQSIWRVGLVDSTNQQPSNGLWFRYIDNSGCSSTGMDTQWIYESRSNGTSTTASSGVAANIATVYRLRLRSTTTGTVLFSVSTNGGAFSTETPVTTTLPTTALSPAFEVVSCDSNAHRMLVDRFDYLQSGLVR